MLPGLRESSFRRVRGRKSGLDCSLSGFIQGTTFSMEQKCLLPIKQKLTQTGRRDGFATSILFDLQRTRINLFFVLLFQNIKSVDSDKLCYEIITGQNIIFYIKVFEEFRRIRQKRE